MSLKIIQKDNTEYMSKTVRKPTTFEDCVANLRINNCEMCSFKPRRGATWKKCGLRVGMFLREGGNIV
jgi:hypothetical protein